MMRLSSPTSLGAASAGAPAATGATPNTDQAGGPLTDGPPAAEGFPNPREGNPNPREGKSKETEGNPNQAEGKSKAIFLPPIQTFQWLKSRICNRGRFPGKPLSQRAHSTPARR